MMATRTTNAVSRPAADARRPPRAQAEFSRCLRRERAATDEKAGLPPMVTLAAPVPAAPERNPSAASAVSVAPLFVADAEILGDILARLCFQSLQQSGPLEVTFREGWLQGAVIRVELGREIVHCRIKAPAARQREAIKKAMAHVATRLSSSGLRLGGFEVSR